MGNTLAFLIIVTGLAVHPHGRGEHSAENEQPQYSVGSSPRAWGTQYPAVTLSTAPRFIPTGVGNTPDIGQYPAVDAVHPHGRGEHACLHAGCWSVAGSSPRAWGTRDQSPGQSRVWRFIPTGVGNTKRWGLSAQSGTVHPHGRGEHATTHRSCGVGNGSSPRAWGTRADGQAERRYSTVHPHGRGEHFSANRSNGISTGSSPRAWGTLSFRNWNLENKRFIPTGVGNTCSECSWRVCPAVHPHGRGEHAVPNVASVLVQRFIPTGVGNTRADGAWHRDHSVHPHGRGEHMSRARSGGTRPGSSPRAWGTLAYIDDSSDLYRFIPTGVGNTPYMGQTHTPIPVHPHGRGEHTNHNRLMLKRKSSPKNSTDFPGFRSDR